MLRINLCFFSIKHSILYSISTRKEAKNAIIIMLYNVVFHTIFILFFASPQGMINNNGGRKNSVDLLTFLPEMSLKMLSSVLALSKIKILWKLGMKNQNRVRCVRIFTKSHQATVKFFYRLDPNLKK